MRAFIVAALLFGAVAARADDLGDLLRAGPLVRIESDASGKLKQSTCIADVDASIDLVWKVLTDYDQYRFFMPRVKSLDVAQDNGDALLSFKLDTPLVATSYTNRHHVDAATHTMTVKQEKGDLSGSRYQWHLVSLGDNKTRLYYSGLIKNYSSIAESFEDDQHTLSIGVNVVSLMATAQAVKLRSETLAKQVAAKAP
jgi:hypothetical protein